METKVPYAVDLYVSQDLDGFRSFDGGKRTVVDCAVDETGDDTTQEQEDVPVIGAHFGRKVKLELRAKGIGGFVESVPLTGACQPFFSAL